MERALSTFIIPTVEEYVEEPLQIQKSSFPSRLKECIFCTIAHGEDTSTNFLYKVINFIYLIAIYLQS